VSLEPLQHALILPFVFSPCARLDARAHTQLREEREQKKALKSMTRQQLELYRRAKREARRLVQAGLDARRASRQQQRLLAARGVGGRRTAELATWAARAARAAGALEQQLEEAECPKALSFARFAASVAGGCGGDGGGAKHLGKRSRDGASGSSSSSSSGSGGSDSSQALALAAAAECGSAATKPQWLATLGPVDESTAAAIERFDGPWLLAESHKGVVSRRDEYSSDDSDSGDSTYGSGSDSDCGRGGNNFSTLEKMAVTGEAYLNFAPVRAAPTATRGANAPSRSEFRKLGPGVRAGKPVELIDDNDDTLVLREWSSATNAAADLGVGIWEVSDACCGRADTAKGFRLRYKYRQAEPKSSSNVARTPGKGSSSTSSTASSSSSSSTAAAIPSALDRIPLEPRVVVVDPVAAGLKKLAGFLSESAQNRREPVQNRRGGGVAGRSTRRDGDGSADGGLYVPQVGDQVCYYQAAHEEALAHEADEDDEEDQDTKRDDSKSKTSDKQRISSAKAKKPVPPAPASGTPSWFRAPGSPHAVDCTVTAVTHRFQPDWPQKLYDRCDMVLSALEANDNIAWFDAPVEPELQGVPDYFDVRRIVFD